HTATHHAPRSTLFPYTTLFRSAMTSDRVYRRGKSYEAASQELDDWAGRQFDPKVVEAFHRVPKSDWDELHRRSLMTKRDEYQVSRMVEMIESQREALVTQ